MKKLIVGNWKMNPQSQKEAEVLFKSVITSMKGLKNVEVALCVPFTFLYISKKLKNKKVALGAQNLSVEPAGAHTGEVSAAMLRDMGVTYVIVGHSERRALGETDDVVNKKVLIALRSKLTPIICVGESVRATDGEYLTIVKDQLLAALIGVNKNQLKDIVIAYEPVWALSSTENRHDATPHDFEEMKIYIRKILSDLFSTQTARSVRIIYGGSANKDNARTFLQVGAEGLLPGKASLDPRNFAAIVNCASNIK